MVKMKSIGENSPIGSSSKPEFGRAFFNGRLNFVSVARIARNEMIQSAIAIGVLILLLLTSCAGNSVQLNPALMQQAASEAKSDRLNAALTEKNIQIKRPFSTSDYKIGPEDLLEITVFQAKELDTVARVSATGYIKLPLIDKIKASGLTTSELESLLIEKLKKYLSDPVASVFIKEYRSQQIIVLGSVKNPGVFNVVGQRCLLDLLSTAGGLNPDAGDICIIQRNSKSQSRDGAKEKNIVIDLDQLLIDGRVDLNIALAPGDVILVPRSGIFFVDGAVQSPGSFPLKGRITLTQAISMARGLSYEAIKSGIKIYRDNGKRERDVISVDYDEILDRKIPDVELKDKDIVIVAASGFKRFINGLTGYFNFGGIGLSGAKGFPLF
jgi:polysaccharide export outer membrane protein